MPVYATTGISGAISLFYMIVGGIATFFLFVVFCINFIGALSQRYSRDIFEFDEPSDKINEEVRRDRKRYIQKSVFFFILMLMAGAFTYHMAEY